jgi:hypothetical protein
MAAAAVIGKSGMNIYPSHVFERMARENINIS